MEQCGETADREALVQACITAGQRLLGAGQAEAAKAQFEAAIDLVYRHYQDEVYRLCLSRLRNAVWAEEVSQEVLSAVYFALPAFRHEASVRTWLSGICHRQIKQALRNVGRRYTLFEANQEAVLAGVHPAEHADAVQALLEVLREYEQHLDNLRRKDSLRGAATTEISVRLRNYSASHFEGSAYGVHRLRPRDQILFVKRFIEGYSIAELTTPWRSEAAVRQRLAQIVQQLQRQNPHG